MQTIVIIHVSFSPSARWDTLLCCDDDIYLFFFRSLQLLLGSQGKLGNIGASTIWSAVYVKLLGPVKTLVLFMQQSCVICLVCSDCDSHMEILLGSLHFIMVHFSHIPLHEQFSYQINLINLPFSTLCVLPFVYISCLDSNKNHCTLISPIKPCM